MIQNTAIDTRRQATALPEMSQEARYHKNVLYITPEQQEKIKNTRIIFAGVGLGSVLAEAALRMGFENFVLIDGDTVEASNLNRQNYCEQDLGESKVVSIARRLQSINPEVKVEHHHLFLNPENIAQYLEDCHIAINAIDFDAEKTPFVFDETCITHGIPVIHPLNFGWAGAAYLVTPESEQIYEVPREDGRFEFVLIDQMLDYFQNRTDLNLSWFEGFRASYQQYSHLMSPPQLSVGSYLAAAVVTDILFSWVNGLKVKTFPKPYFLTAR